MEGKLVIFSAPSGSGKTTIVRHLLNTRSDLGFSISACTRDRRGRNETHGKDYYFLTPDEFKQKIDNNEFVEWEEVYAGAYYGTLRAEVERLWQSGKHVIFDVDVKGGLELKKAYGDRALAVFVKAPSEEVIKERLMARGTETEESLSKRLFKVRFEMSFQNKFDVILVNDILEDTLQKAESLVENFLNVL
ncbi:MAG: guanylate kinase [Runella slithyformis]|nr:MAG: guanylate kinase [Runella slithyformis]TAE92971.1 MAG: guanylate kinase [Runella slithyformis]TAF29983.1 MAG: guanylate kinase [Runella slithyformis]TAF49099.1 MAG: guanylate kinase [Runella slithyformis]TAF83594.1 MAG: guanylate kinase [Runella slithyformis]